MKTFIIISILLSISVNLKAEENLKFYVKKALENNFQLNAEKKNLESAKQSKNISRSEFLPSITLSGEQNSSSSTNRTNQNGVSLSDSSSDTQSNSFIVIFSAFFFTLLLSILIWRAQSKEISISKVFVALQGYLIFLPAIYFQDLILAFAVGISIHYLQYLAISFPVCKKSFGFSFIPLILFLLGYSLLSTGSLSGFFSNEKISLIIFIPTSLQLLHFYFDGFIWRKSNTIVRETLSRASF